ncbi:hypothetical protein AB0G83_30145 [Streptomyces klenkii]|uniref:hypothetical protein n=1 Tax=Streptomyces klenkii TaxID=1420899 RepID=UPI0033F6ADFC
MRFHALTVAVHAPGHRRSRVGALDYLSEIHLYPGGLYAAQAMERHKSVAEVEDLRQGVAQPLGR